MNNAPGGDLVRRRVPAAMDLLALLMHPCGICGRPVAWGARRCPRCGVRGVLLTHGPAHVQGRHWLFAFAVVIVPFVAAVWAAHQR